MKKQVNLAQLQKEDTSKDSEERIRSFVQQVGDPFHFQIDEVAVNLHFNEDGVTLLRLLERAFAKREWI